MLPGFATIDRTVQSAARSTAGKIPRLPSGLPKGGEKNARITRIEHDIDSACIFVFEQNVPPATPAIGRFENPAFTIRAEGMPQCRVTDTIRICRMHYHSTDAPAICG